MSDSIGRTYSKVGYNQGIFVLDTISLPGTAASITAAANSQVVLPIGAVIRAAQAFIKTGGTAAGPVCLLQYSVDGTGTWTTFGSAASGTDADNAVKAFTVTATSLDAGDALRLAIAAGTAAATPVWHVSVAFTERFIEVS